MRECCLPAYALRPSGEDHDRRAIPDRSFDKARNLFADSRAHRAADEEHLHRPGVDRMLADFPARADNRFRRARNALRLPESFRVWLGVRKFQRVYGDHLGVQLLIVAVVKEHREARRGVETEMVITVRADLYGFFEVSFVERRVAFLALDEDVFGFYAPFFDRYGLTLPIL